MSAKRSHRAAPAAVARATRYGLSARDRQRLVYALSALGDCRTALLRAMYRTGDPMRGEIIDRATQDAYETVIGGLRRIVGDE